MEKCGEKKARFQKTGFFMVKFPCFRLIFACFGGKVGNQK